ncbi:MAG: excinuclease ABC subunit UvrC, partial [Deltaproteobacteria bacterium]|nr:excinuclease ABC subunit UvrC [Deltaproteobacteria bacterium]
HQMGACLAPCCLNVDPEKYREIVNEVVLILKGRTPELIQQVKAKMKVAAGSQDFETAAMHRDKMYYLKKTLEKQVSVTTDFIDRDVLALARTEEMSVITLFAVRGGYLLGSRHIHVKETLSTDEEIMGTFIRHYYDRMLFIPKEILVSALPDDTALIENWLKNIKGQKVSVKNPKRGEKARLLSMAFQNAENKLMETAASATAEKELLERIQNKLRLKNIPERIECFDNSNISGTDAVAGMAVFVKGRPDKSSYRKFSIRTVRKHDDYAYMKEVLTRRYGNASSRLPYPDLLLIDGGKGHLNIAVSVLKKLQLTGMFAVVSIAKKDETKGEGEDKIYKPVRVNPVNFGQDRDLLLFLQRVRDEAHRFAVSYHRQQRRATAMHSKLDTISGIGRKRKAAMLKKFGSIKKIRAASIEEISALPGLNRKVAETVKKTLSG